MMSIIMLILGVLLIMGTLISVIYSATQTPDNLQDFYGLFYGIISSGGFIGGFALVVFALLC